MKRCCISLLVNPLFKAAFRDANIGAGVPTGAKIPYQRFTAYPGTPASAIVGTSGSNALRWLVVTPRTRSFPLVMNDLTEA